MGHDVDDPSDITGKAQRQLDRVHDQVDHEADRRAILSWGREMLTRDLSPATVTNRVNPIVKLHERADRPLSEFDSKDDVTNLLAAFGNGSHPDVPSDGLASGTLRQYRQAAKLFFRDQLGFEWGDDIIIGAADPTPITEDQILTNDDVDALLDGADDPRDRAFAAFLTVTGQRITAALSIRLGDVALDQQSGTITLNSDAVGLKGATGPRPLLWARPFIAQWLSVHPRRDEDGAPLFCATQSGRRPQEDGGWVTWEKGDPVSPSQVRNRLRDLADAVGVDRAKVKPHNFRHTAITRMRDEGVSDDRIKFMVGVAPDSDIIERYDKQSDQRMLDRVREAYGMETPGSEVGQPTMENCPQCTAPLRGSARFCDSCGTPLDMAAAEEQQATRDAVADDMVDAEDPREREVARSILDDVDDPDLVEAVADRVLEKLDGH